MNIAVEDVKECLEGAFKNLAEAMDIAEQAYQQIRDSTVYVVMVAKGEYSDREVNCRLVFLDEEEAKKHVENLTLEVNSYDEVKFYIEEVKIR